MNIKRDLPNIAQHELGETVYEKSQEIRDISLEGIVNQISQYPAKNIVITGGEPLLQKKELFQLFSFDFFQDKFIEIETNGTIEPFDETPIDIHYNVSPKLINSFNPSDRRYKPEVLKKFVDVDAIFKFVVDSLDDILEISEIIESVGMPKERVYLMPKAQNEFELKQNGAKVFEIAMENGYAYSHRVHIQLFGSKRGI